MNTVKKHISEDQKFYRDVDYRLLSHEIILNNPYCQWFRKGEMSLTKLQNFTIQFSVFSNLFLVAQLKKVINAHDLQSMRASKEILGSEIGVNFSPKNKRNDLNLSSIDNDFETPASTEGSIEGGVFRFQAAHFEWLLKFSKPLGLKFDQLGKRRNGLPTTLHFVDKLEELYGHEDYSIAAGASFAIENWANKGFWKDLISGLRLYQENNNLSLPLGFFIWHDRVEDQHAQHTQHELNDLLNHENFHLDREKFLKSGEEILDALKIFWDGLLK